MSIPSHPLEQINLESTLHIILQNAVAALSGGAGVIADWDEAEGRFRNLAVCGLSPSAALQLQPFLDEAAPHLAASHDSFNLLSILQPDLGLPLAETGIRQDPIIVLPLKIGSRTLGLIYVLRPLNSAAFSHPDRPVLLAFAGQAAVSLQNAHLAEVLSAEKQRLEAVLENSADGILSLDSGCLIVGFNRAMEKITGYLRDEALGRHCSAILKFETAAGHSLCREWCPMQSAGQAELPLKEHQLAIRNREGRHIEVATVYSIVRSPQGKAINSIINVRDITHLREIENLRETILSMIGHELQTPLTIIKGYTSTLTQPGTQWDETLVRQALHIIEEESDRLSEVMNKLLLASRLSSGTWKLEKEPVQLATLVNKVVHRLQTLTTKHQFKIDFPPDFPSVNVDPSMLEHVLTNLIDNAIKYSPAGGLITVTAQASPDEIRISVSDQGIGIPGRDMDHLFESFYRTHRSKQHKIQGIGLGLYISKSIITAHGGRMEVSNRSPRGSEFSFILPLEKN